MCYNNVKSVEVNNDLVHFQYLTSVLLKLLFLLSQFLSQPALHVHISVALSTCLTVSSLELRFKGHPRKSMFMGYNMFTL